MTKHKHVAQAACFCFTIDMSFIQKHRKFLVLLFILTLVLIATFNIAVQTGYINKTMLGSQKCDGLVAACGYCPHGIKLSGYCYSL